MAEQGMCQSMAAKLEMECNQARNTKLDYRLGLSKAAIFPQATRHRTKVSAQNDVQQFTKIEASWQTPSARPAARLSLVAVARP